MEGRKEYFLKNISELLSVLESSLRINGKNHYFDLHTGAEDPICGLLNHIFGYELVNMNHQTMNFPGIDLADRERRIAVQVTSDGSRQKIVKTLDAFNAPSMRCAFDHVIIVIMGRKPAYRQPFDSNDLKLEIFSTDELVRLIASLEDGRVEKIASYLQSAFIFRSDGSIPAVQTDADVLEKLWDEMPMLQEHYLRRFQGVLVRKNERSLTLQDLYIPNPFVLAMQAEPKLELMDLIEQFVRNRWDLPRQAFGEPRTLIIEGQQCTGKSTLVACILDRAYFRWGMSPKNIHLLSFAERELRNMDLNIRNICGYLGLDSDKRLKDGLLIIDALDESDWSSQKVSMQLECLMDSLMRYGCRLIVTTRKNYLSNEGFEDALIITLLPFALEHAQRWLELYGTVDPEMDLVRLKADLRAVPEEVRRVILLPHILQICVTHGIALGSVINLNQLYQLLFRGNDGLFLRDQFFPDPNARHRRIQQMMDAAVAIAVKCMQQDNRISARELDAYIQASCPQMERLKTEYLLERREDDCYAFAHRTIPSYLIAQALYDAFSTPESRLSDHELLTRISPMVTADGVLSEDVIRSLEQMSRRDEPIAGDRALKLLHQLLTDQLEHDVLCTSGHYHHAVARYALWFSALCRLVFALKAAWREENEDYRFLETLSPEALQRFVRFCDPGTSVQRSWDFLRHCMLHNFTWNEIDLSGISMPFKRIYAMVMHRAKFRGSILRGSYVIDSDLSAACFDGAYCTAAQFSNDVLCSASFRDSRLRGVMFRNCDLSYADLRGADLSKVRFHNCILNGLKIDARQLHEYFDLFDLDTIREKNIRLYIDECELPDELVADEYRRQRPTHYFIHHNKEVFSGGNIKKAEMVRRVIASHQGRITTAEIQEACPRVSRTTIHCVLRNLMQSNEITKVSGGRYTAYIWNK